MKTYSHTKLAGHPQILPENPPSTRWAQLYNIYGLSIRRNKLKNLDLWGEIKALISYIKDATVHLNALETQILNYYYYNNLIPYNKFGVWGSLIVYHTLSTNLSK